MDRNLVLGDTGPKADLDRRVGCLRGDAALVAAVARHPDVAVLAPSGTPRVLDDIVAVTVADRQHTVIQEDAVAVRLVVDAARVELERDVRGVDGDGDRADVGQGVGERVLVLRRDVRVSGEGGRVGRLGLAVAVSGRVRVRSLGLDAAVVFDVAEAGGGTIVLE